ASAVQRAPAALSRCASSSVAARDLGRAATIASRDAQSAPASAAAEPPPGVGLGERKASRRAVTERSVSVMDDGTALDHRGDRRGADPDQIYRIAGDEDGIHQLAGLEAADAVVAIEGVRAVDGGGGERFL